jgi:hypothetical protein
MTQGVICRTLTAETRVRAQVNLCGICGGQSGTGTGISPGSSAFSCQYHSKVAIQLISSGDGQCLLVAAVQRRRLIPSKSINQTKCRANMVKDHAYLLTGGRRLSSVHLSRSSPVSILTPWRQNPQVHIRIHKSPPPDPILSQLDPLYTPSQSP